ncbi:MAG: T9SS type A sorting domain-containing protein [Saprospiraceae bacterium]
MKLIYNLTSLNSIFSKTMYCLLFLLLLTQSSIANSNNTDSSQLGRFSAKVKNCEVVVIWNTLSETDLKLFELEWSGDGQNFYKIHTQFTSGFSPNTGLYEFVDLNSSYSNYYRLKMINFDGSFKYSKNISAKKECKGNNTLSVFPNPVSVNSNIINLEFTPTRSQSQVLINDMLGRTIQRLNLEVDSGISNKFELDISNYPAGTYNMIIVGERQAKIFVIK